MNKTLTSNTRTNSLFTGVLGCARGDNSRERLLTSTASNDNTDVLVADLVAQPEVALYELYAHRSVLLQHPPLLNLLSALCRATASAREPHFGNIISPLAAALGLQTPESPSQYLSELARLELRAGVHVGLECTLFGDMRCGYVDRAHLAAAADDLFVESFPAAAAGDLYRQGIAVLAERWLEADAFYIPLTPFPREIEALLRKVLPRDENGTLILEADNATIVSWERAIRKRLGRKRLPANHWAYLSPPLQTNKTAV